MGKAIEDEITSREGGDREYGAVTGRITFKASLLFDGTPTPHPYSLADG
jgi:hypothetical protein